MGPFRLTKILAGPMILRGHGTVVFVTSDAAVQATALGRLRRLKAALDQMARVWGAELDGTGVRIFSVDPGEMNTKMHADAVPDADPSTLAEPPRSRAHRRAPRASARHPQRRAHRGVDVPPRRGAGMKAATWPRPGGQARLLAVDPSSGALRHARFDELERLLAPGDLVVLNDAATLPASLRGRTADGAPIELRLLGREGARRFRAVAFGEGDHHVKTEDRGPPPPLEPGARLAFGERLAFVVRAIEPDAPRLITLEVEGPSSELDGAFWTALYRAGRPVQYAYVDRALALFHVQTAYAARPWAVEMPSAGHALSWSILLELRRRGVGLATVTHAAGLPSIGGARLDARLPLPERYEVPQATARAVLRTRREGGRVVAVGTTVFRALEGAAAARGGELAAGEGVTDLRIGPAHRPRVVDGLLTGVHEPGTSHFELLQALAPRAVIERMVRAAEEAGYLGHEFGDAALILPWSPAKAGEDLEPARRAS